MRIRSFNCVSQVVGAMSLVASMGSSASAALTLWTDQAAWEAAVQPQWHLDFPGGPMTIIPRDYYASSGIQLTEGFSSGGAGEFLIGDGTAMPPWWESRSALHFTNTNMGMVFSTPVYAVGVIAPSANIFPFSVKLADGTIQSTQFGSLVAGWNFFGVTSTSPIIGYSQANHSIDMMWLSNPVPAPATVTLIALCGGWRRRTR